MLPLWEVLVLHYQTMCVPHYRPSVFKPTETDM